jgi:signal transduction histidine kinase
MVEEFLEVAAGAAKAVRSGVQKVEDISLHILDVVENSVRSAAKRIEISLVEDQEQDLLTLEIRDDGKGMGPEDCARSTDPFFTTKSGRRIGLGLALLSQAAREAGGEFHVRSQPEAGTTVTATFRRSHPDCKPLGDIAATLETLVTAYPDVDVVYEQRVGAEITRFDAREVRRTWRA